MPRTPGTGSRANARIRLAAGTTPRQRAKTDSLVSLRPGGSRSLPPRPPRLRVQTHQGDTRMFISSFARDMFAGLVRHFATFGGGWLVAHGLLAKSQYNSWIGS